MSVGDGTTILSRFAKGSGGQPVDVSVPRIAIKLLPANILANILKKSSNAVIDHEGYGIRTKHTKLPLTGRVKHQFLTGFW